MGQASHQRGLCSEWKWWDLTPALYEAKACTRGQSAAPGCPECMCGGEVASGCIVVVELRDTTGASVTGAQWSAGSHLALLYSELTLAV